jgi:hypothetical protein
MSREIYRMIMGHKVKRLSDKKTCTEKTENSIFGDQLVTTKISGPVQSVSCAELDMQDYFGVRK